MHMTEDRKNRVITIEAPAFAPVHMKGADEIAAVFGVARETVVQWSRKGAPVYLVGKKYQANYAEMWDWIKQKGKLAKGRQAPTSYSQPPQSLRDGPKT